jgi:hypothetical protein
MDSTSPDAIVALLEDGRLQVRQSVAGLSDADAAAKPDPARWSVLECLDHIEAVEHRFLGFAKAGGTAATRQIDVTREHGLAARVVDRSTRVVAPEAVAPTGRYHSVDEALRAFDAARDITIAFVRSRGDGLYDIAAAHPRFGDVNGVELMHLLNGHALRHVAQIAEARDALAR